MTSTSGVRQVARKGFPHCTHYIVPRALDLTRAIQLGLCRTSCSKHVFRRFAFALGGARKDAPKRAIAQPINTTLRQSHNDLATCGQAASETRNSPGQRPIGVLDLLEISLVVVWLSSPPNPPTALGGTSVRVFLFLEFPISVSRSWRPVICSGF